MPFKCDQCLCVVDCRSDWKKQGLCYISLSWTIRPAQYYHDTCRNQNRAQGDLRARFRRLLRLNQSLQALLVSPRNSLAAHLNLLENTQCNVFVTAEPLPPLTRKILAQRPMAHIIVPELEHWLSAPIAGSYPYEKVFEQARYEPFVAVHTSGSTGKPSLINERSF